MVVKWLALAREGVTLAASSGNFAFCSAKHFPCFAPCPLGCRIALCSVSFFFLKNGFEPVFFQPVARSLPRGATLTWDWRLKWARELAPSSRESGCKLSQQQGKQLKGLGSFLEHEPDPREVPRDPCRTSYQSVESSIVLSFKHPQRVCLIAIWWVLRFSGYLLVQFCHLAVPAWRWIRS